MPKMNNPLRAFQVTLGIDRAARPTGQTLELTLLAASRLDAAIEAERIGDTLVPDQSVMYTVCKSVNEIIKNKPALAAAAA